MSRRTKIIIAIGLLAVIAAGLLWWWFSRSARAPSAPAAAPVTPSGAPTVPVAPPAPALPLSAAVIPRSSNGTASPVSIQVLARSFLERYGSYSNQSNFENIENLYPFMTSRMQSEAQAFVAAERAKAAGGQLSYSGITTRVLSITVQNQTTAAAQMMLIAQRTEAKAGAAPRVYYQNAELNLRSISGTWKIDAVTWQ